MEEVLRKKVIVGDHGQVQVESSGLPKGTEAEVVVLVEPKRQKRSYRELFGSGRGGFSTPEEATRFLREERNAWGE